jgi:hypothetical protein
MNQTQRLRHNWQRMKVLKALNEHAGVAEWVDFGELLDVLDKMDAPMVPDQLAYHLKFCEEWNWVELKRGRTDQEVNGILKVKLTAAGLDRIDIGKMPELEETQGLRRKK